MPTSQISSNGGGGGQPLIESVVVANRPPPPPNKLPPPPPPPPPKNNRPLPVVPPLPPPPPPPPPPPRNSSQLGGNPIPVAPNINLHNNGTLVNPPGGFIGRCSGRSSVNPNGVVGTHQPAPNQRGFTRHGECGSRSSVSSHSSMSHHYHGACLGTSSNNTGAQSGPTVHCGHQPSMGNCAWSAANQQHNHVNSSNASDNGKCNMYHDQGVGCCSHPATLPNKFQSQTSANPLQTTTISRSILYPDELDNHHPHETRCNGDHPPQVMGQTPHHHHHHHHHSHHHELPLHGVQANPDPSNIPLINEGHRCMNGGTNSEPHMTVQPCCHSHKLHNGCTHQPVECCDHHANTNIVQQQQVLSPGAHHTHCGGGGSCGTHSHSGGTLHHECNTSTSMMSNNNLGAGSDSCVQGRHHHHHHHHHPGQCPNHHVPARCQDSSSSSFNNGVSPSSVTAHVHNLSNSSTTTHTSNVAVKQHQLQFQQHNQRPVLSRAARSSSSQHYEQYGLSSAASTSSATASLSSYQTRSAYEDVAGGCMPSYPSSRIHQPLPPAPPPPPSSSSTTTTLPFHNHALASAKSQPASPLHQMFMSQNNNHIVGSPVTLAPTAAANVSSQNVQVPFNYLQQTVQHQQQQQPPPPPPPPPLPPLSTLQLHISQQPLPPLPPKPESPNASSCSWTTVRTSPITRITSHAGLEGPIPCSDVPPPPPPLKHGLRTQPLVNALSKMTLNEDSNSSMNRIENEPPPLGPLLNYSRGGIITDAARKTEDIARQVEMDIEQKRRSGQPLGVCGICKANVMPLQPACEAGSQIFHTHCFVCCECGRPLQGKKYYPVGDKAYCEEDFKYTGHMKSLEKCAACGQPIFDMILPALSKFYHPNCFKCCVCQQCLDGVPFTIDRENRIYCIRDYHNIHSPKCAKCGKPISPIDGTSETVRVVSMDKDYHVDCYCCEDCGLQLTDEEPSRCFPLDNHLLCQTCHIGRLTVMKPALSLN